MQITLHDQIGRNVEDYVDDLVMKSRKKDDLLSDLLKTFNNLRKNRIMLNPKKCVFGVDAGKLLSFLVSHQEIDVNPEKIKSIKNM